MSTGASGADSRTTRGAVTHVVPGRAHVPPGPHVPTTTSYPSWTSVHVQRDVERQTEESGEHRVPSQNAMSSEIDVQTDPAGHPSDGGGGRQYVPE